MKKEINVIPLYDGIFITALKKAVSGSKIIENAQLEYEEVQRVVTIGKQCPEEIMVDDLVVLNLELGVSRFVIPKYESNSLAKDINGNYKKGYNFPIKVINGIEYMLITPRDIEYIIPVNDAHFTTEELLERRKVITKTPIIV